MATLREVEWVALQSTLEQLERGALHPTLGEVEWGAPQSILEEVEWCALYSTLGEAEWGALQSTLEEVEWCALHSTLEEGVADRFYVLISIAHNLWTLLYPRRSRVRCTPGYSVRSRVRYSPLNSRRSRVRGRLCAIEIKTWNLSATPSSRSSLECTSLYFF